MAAKELTFWKQGVFYLLRADSSLQTRQRQAIKKTQMFREDFELRKSADSVAEATGSASFEYAEGEEIRSEEQQQVLEIIDDILSDYDPVGEWTRKQFRFS